MRAPGAGLKERAVEELKAFWLISLYLALFLGALTFYRRLIVAEFGVSYLHYGIAVVEALIIAKVILIGKAIGVGGRLERSPLIVSVIGKSILFGALVLLFGILEHVVEGLLHKADPQEILHSLVELGIYELLARMLMMIVAFVPFFAFWEIGRVIGPRKLSTLFFSKQATAPVAVAHLTAASTIRTGLMLRTSPAMRPQSAFAFSIIAARSFLMSAGDNWGRSTLIVTLLSFAVRRTVAGVLVVDAGQRVGADIEALVPLQDHRQRALHPLRRDHSAVHFQRAGAGLSESAEVVELERAHADALVLEVELDRMPPGDSASGPSHLRRSRSTRFHRNTGLPCSR